jgi:hypothetical protein
VAGRVRGHVVADGKTEGEPEILALGTRRITRSEFGSAAVPSAVSVKRLIWL